MTEMWWHISDNEIGFAASVVRLLNALVEFLSMLLQENGNQRTLFKKNLKSPYGRQES
jgi:hypothetical protein